MKANKKQTEFIEGIFDYYHLNKYHFFSEYDDEIDEVVDIPLYIDEHLSQALGMTVDEITSMDNDAAMRWSNKYEFFKYYHDYDFQWSISARYADGTTPADVLLSKVFGEKINYRLKERYNYKAIEQRLIHQLKEIDTVIPGTFHYGATISNLKISTEVFFSFPQVPKMLESFIDIFNNVESLFFKALVEDLSEDEVKEYNFLVHWLQMTDIVVPSRLLTYDVVKMFRTVFLSEGYHKLTSYARIHSFVDTSPWRCKEFFEDLDSIRKFVETFPETKGKMREFSTKVSNFECGFVWSDAQHITFSREDEDDYRDFCESVNEKYLEPEERAKEPTFVDVPKTEEEMFDWAPYVKRIKKITQSSSKGGLVLPKPEADFQTLHDTKRIMKRVSCPEGGILND